MEVVVPGELAAVIVLKELRQVPRNADGEDERDGHPEWSVKIGIDALWVMLNDKMVREGRKAETFKKLC